MCTFNMTIKPSKLIQLQTRIQELEHLADEVIALSGNLRSGSTVQPKLAIKGQQWYRGARELLVQQAFSGLKEFDNCYQHYETRGSRDRTFRTRTDIEKFINLNSCQQEEYELFERFFRKARSLVHATVDEVLSRELPTVTQLSFELSADEFETAEDLLSQSGESDPLVRASGVIAGVALERHLHTVIDKRSLKIQSNPLTKKKADISDLSNTLFKEGVITGIQKSELDSLFMIRNHCAHPKEDVKFEDVKRLIERGRSLAAVIL